ncbi:hypothetical protein, partial [Parasutterella excrementihominis]|uniref:hypothetical protein n=1 Tax=Parasutterella excrementihominis TaxID=487175 RepID=UPI0019D60AD3
DNLYALPQDGSGINWILKLHNDPSKARAGRTLEQRSEPINTLVKQKEQQIRQNTRSSVSDRGMTR